MTMKNFLLPALAVVGIALTSAKTKADDGSSPTLACE